MGYSPTATEHWNGVRLSSCFFFRSSLAWRGKHVYQASSIIDSLYFLCGFCSFCLHLLHALVTVNFSSHAKLLLEPQKVCMSEAARFLPKRDFDREIKNRKTNINNRKKTTALVCVSQWTRDNDDWKFAVSPSSHKLLAWSEQNCPSSPHQTSNSSFVSACSRRILVSESPNIIHRWEHKSN